MVHSAEKSESMRRVRTAARWKYGFALHGDRNRYAAIHIDEYLQESARICATFFSRCRKLYHDYTNDLEIDSRHLVSGSMIPEIRENTLYDLLCLLKIYRTFFPIIRELAINIGFQLNIVVTTLFDLIVKNNNPIPLMESIENQVETFEK